MEHVIIRGIELHPDSIFDVNRGMTIYDWFNFYDYEDIWEQILEEQGIDPDWAWDEKERRKRVMTGATSARDIDTPVQNASDILQVKRRQPFEAHEA
jgi:hypothetical protein